MTDEAMTHQAPLDTCRAVDDARIALAHDAFRTLAAPRTPTDIEARVVAREALERAQGELDAVALCVLHTSIAEAFRRANMSPHQWADNLLGQKVRPS